jgi:hypothetical protein
MDAWELRSATPDIRTPSDTRFEELCLRCAIEGAECTLSPRSGRSAVDEREDFDSVPIERDFFARRGSIASSACPRHGEHNFSPNYTAKCGTLVRRRVVVVISCQESETLNEEVPSCIEIERALVLENRYCTRAIASEVLRIWRGKGGQLGMKENF